MMTSLNRMLSVLDLFTAERPVWEADRIVEALGCSTPTGYRYLKELMHAGLLQRFNGGYYALGPRITLLDYVIRSTDPLLAASIPQMRELVTLTGCHCTLSRLDGDVFLDLHHECSNQEIALVYGRGRPRPMFSGSAPKVVIANQTSKQQRGLFERYREEVLAAGLGETEEAFLKRMLQIRKAGCYRADEELAAGVSSLSVPLRFAPKEHCAALALVSSTQHFAQNNVGEWQEKLKKAARRISAALDGDTAL
ncbi:IclR family transcriptional regulator [Kluyvera sp. CHPC 1.251]|uniref:IclR family transcriptional regulator n=1 Tax=Kluyvera sp. CHPC 1.251 TaxID=2995175 RepID=UPI002FD85786